MKTTRFTIAQDGKKIFIEYLFAETLIYEGTYPNTIEGSRLAIADAAGWKLNRAPTRAINLIQHT